MNKEYLKEVIFDIKIIEYYKNKINNELQKYVVDNIITEYSLNDEGHNIDHINYVLNRAIEIGKNYELSWDIIYICVMFHDIACHINREKHEILSALVAYEDKYLNSFFTKQEMNIIKEAIEDHRASLEYIPRNIYGKILSSADRKVDIKSYLIAAIAFELRKHPEMTKEEVISKTYLFAIKKYGKSGYAVNKSYVNDNKYNEFISNLQELIENENVYYDNASIIYDELKNKRLTKKVYN
ncbi:MAG: hypothetical protein PHN42_00325 [Bacilli bacterium]|nr:hypothetical protein [Bacilli bacterium]